MTDEEVAVAVEEAKRRGKRVCAHARSSESVRMCIRHGIEIIYHASYADEETLDMLAAAKDKHFVAPGLALARTHLGGRGRLWHQPGFSARPPVCP